MAPKVPSCNHITKNKQYYNKKKLAPYTLTYSSAVNLEQRLSFQRLALEAAL
jgi:hypothetical protein